MDPESYINAYFDSWQKRYANRVARRNELLPFLLMPVQEQALVMGGYACMDQCMGDKDTLTLHLDEFPFLVEMVRRRGSISLSVQQRTADVSLWPAAPGEVTSMVLTAKRAEPRIMIICETKDYGGNSTLYEMSLDSRLTPQDVDARIAAKLCCDALAALYGFFELQFEVEED